jgi:hypothetical protein
MARFEALLRGYQNSPSCPHPLVALKAFKLCALSSVAREEGGPGHHICLHDLNLLSRKYAREAFTFAAMNNGLGTNVRNGMQMCCATLELLLVSPSVFSQLILCRIFGGISREVGFQVQVMEASHDT